jgi:hypothetical protein
VRPTAVPTPATLPEWLPMPTARDAAAGQCVDVGEGGFMAMSRQGKAQSSRVRPHRGLGELQDLRRKMWQAVIEAEALLIRPRASTSTKLRAVHALTQAGAAYHRLLQASDFEQRLTKMEQALQALQARNGHGYG